MVSRHFSDSGARFQKIKYIYIYIIILLYIYDIQVKYLEFGLTS